MITTALIFLLKAYNALVNNDAYFHTNFGIEEANRLITAFEEDRKTMGSGGVQ